MVTSTQRTYEQVCAEHEWRVGYQRRTEAMISDIRADRQAMFGVSQPSEAELAQLRPASQELEQIRASLPDTNQPQAQAQNDELTRLRAENADVLRLRNEVRQLREQNQQLHVHDQSAAWHPSRCTRRESSAMLGVPRRAVAISRRAETRGGSR